MKPLMYIADPSSLAAVFIISAAAVVSALLLAMGHWFPWEKALRKPLGRIPSYIYGVASILIPASVAMIILEQTLALITVWACALAGGFATVLGYAADKFLDLSILKDQHEQHNQRVDQFFEEQQ